MPEFTPTNWFSARWPMEGHLHRVQLEAADGLKDHGRGHFQGRGRTQPGAEGDGAVDQPVEARQVKTRLPAIFGNAPHVIGPRGVGAFGQVIQTELGTAVHVQGVEPDLSICAGPGGDPGVPIDGHRHDIAQVVVRVATHEIHPAGGAAPEFRVAFEQGSKFLG